MQEAVRGLLGRSEQREDQALRRCRPRRAPRRRRSATRPRALRTGRRAPTRHRTVRAICQAAQRRVRAPQPPHHDRRRSTRAVRRRRGRGRVAQLRWRPARPATAASIAPPRYRTRRARRVARRRHQVQRTAAGTPARAIGINKSGAGGVRSHRVGQARPARAPARTGTWESTPTAPTDAASAAWASGRKTRCRYTLTATSSPRWPAGLGRASRAPGAQDQGAPPRTASSDGHHRTST